MVPRDGAGGVAVEEGWWAELELGQVVRDYAQGRARVPPVVAVS